MFVCSFVCLPVGLTACSLACLKPVRRDSSYLGKITLVYPHRVTTKALKFNFVRLDKVRRRQQKAASRADNREQESGSEWRTNIDNTGERFNRAARQTNFTIVELRRWMQTSARDKWARPQAKLGSKALARLRTRSGAKTLTGPGWAVGAGHYASVVSPPPLTGARRQ